MRETLALIKGGGASGSSGGGSGGGGGGANAGGSGAAPSERQLKFLALVGGGHDAERERAMGLSSFSASGSIGGSGMMGGGGGGGGSSGSSGGAGSFSNAYGGSSVRRSSGGLKGVEARSDSPSGGGDLDDTAGGTGNGGGGSGGSHHQHAGHSHLQAHTRAQDDYLAQVVSDFGFAQQFVDCIAIMPAAAAGSSLKCNAGWKATICHRYWKRCWRHRSYQFVRAAV